MTLEEIAILVDALDAFASSFAVDDKPIDDATTLTPIDLRAIAKRLRSTRGAVMIERLT